MSYHEVVEDDDLWIALVLSIIFWVFSWIGSYIAPPRIAGILFILFVVSLVIHLFLYSEDIQDWDVSLVTYVVAGVISAAFGGWAAYQSFQDFEFRQLWWILVLQVLLFVGALVTLVFLRQTDKVTRYLICSDCKERFAFVNSEQCPTCKGFDTQEVSKIEYDAPPA